MALPYLTRAVQGKDFMEENEFCKPLKDAPASLDRILAGVIRSCLVPLSL